MGKKLNIYRSHGEKLFSLYLHLSSSRVEHSLTELMNALGCSKQTVLRLIETINMSWGVEIDIIKKGRQNYYKIKRIPTLSMTTLTEAEYHILTMCRDFTSHLLGKKIFDEATSGILKSRALCTNKDITESGPLFSSIHIGTIDYTAHHDAIHTLIDAMKDKKVVTITYQAIMEKSPKTYDIKPLKLFSHKDTVYLHARLCRPDGNDMKTDFDPLLAVHRIVNVVKNDVSFDFPDRYDFEKVYNRHFGIIKDKSFKVTAEFTGWAAKYVAERIYSPDQTIEKKADDRIVLTFTASSEPEVISWILWFGEEARLIAPDDLVTETMDRIERMRDVYNDV